MSDAMEGGCQCGAVRYGIEGKPLDLAVCHCTECQRQSGSAFGMNIKAGALDDTAHLTPAAHDWIMRKQPWVAIPAGTRCAEDDG